MLQLPESNPAVHLPSQHTEDYRTPEKQEIPKDTLVTVNDVGSGEVKMIMCLNGEKIHKAECNFEPQFEHIPNIGETKCLVGDSLDRLVKGLIEMNQQGIQVLEQSGKLTNWKGRNVLALQGFSNSLTMTVDGRTVVLLDEPSLQFYDPSQEDAFDADPNEDQSQSPKLIMSDTVKTKVEAICKIFGKEYIPDKENEIIKTQSSLMKLLVLYQHPEIVEHFFGTNVNLYNVKFGTMQSYLAQQLTGDESIGIPPDDLLGFGINGSVTQEQMAKIFKLLGLYGQSTSLSQRMYRQVRQGGDGPWQIVDDNVENTEGGSHEQILMLAKDLNIEALALMEILKYEMSKNPQDQRLKHDGVYMLADTIGKALMLLPDGKEYPQSKIVEGWNYKTMRNCGRINAIFGKYITRETDTDEVYWKADRIIDSELQNPDSTHNQWFYDPEKGKEGALYHYEDNQWKRVKLSILKGMSEEEMNAPVLAMALGVACAMRNMLPEWVGEEGKTIYAINGIVREGKPGWQRAVASIMPHNCPVEIINMPNGATSSAIVLSKKYGHPVNLDDPAMLSIKNMDSEKIDKLSNYFDEWKTVQASLKN